MKSLLSAMAALLFFATLATTALAANDTAGPSLTPVSISDTATISMPTAGADNMTLIGRFGNATVYVSGGANATIVGDALSLNVGQAARMEYRDVYVLCRIPATFGGLSFDYDLHVGEKSNVLLIGFYGGSPQLGVKKGGIPDQSVVGLGTWTSAYNEERLGSLATFPQGPHHFEVRPDNGVLLLLVDGKVTAFNDFTPDKYLLVHLMVGDENSYLAGTLANLSYQGPSSGDSAGAGDEGRTVIIPNASPGGNESSVVPEVPAGPGADNGDAAATQGTAKPLAGINLWLAVAVGAGFFIAWGVVYFRYLNK